MCLCVNCAYVDRCETYYEVEERHSQPHLTQDPDFTPLHPVINVNIRNHGREMEWDVVGCQSFKLDMGHWARIRPGLAVPT
ncbi:Ycf34 family protein [Anthocerotibacter panamensis]|uniref:Ycf34 family protein n=1 Tax=Anthocerotibacter panamensis TaxID=2857077 RepID=UPI001C404594|nr:Ycf34 family protein [Anthocerotibacter panamensis]